MEQSFGTLFIVATPIGNLEDITLRAIRTLKEADYIAAEDTRHTKKLLSHLGIKTKLISYYRENESQRSQELVKILKQGQNIALVSDAGTPGISDPGAVLVNLAFSENIIVAPIPGPSALTAAISCAGLTVGSFFFHGFLPAKSGQRIKVLESLKDVECPFVVYETPRRARAFLQDCIDTLGDRKAFWGREITKSFEDLRHSTLSILLDKLDDTVLKGELVLVIWPHEKLIADDNTIIEKIKWYDEHSDLKTKEMSKLISIELDVTKSKVYKLALEVLNKK